MAYALRYYKEIAQADGGVVRLEIHKKDSTTAAVEIGAVVQGLSLEIQGQQDDIDSPIQKTSLHMTFVDASDIENGQKNGFWQEFYTPDALMWKVILKAKDATETSFRTIWGGYVTPDSFSEDLVYRGSVSITARDNIGHMQDFPFDAEGDADGMISLYNLVESGWEKIQSPMMLEWRGAADSTMWLMCDGVSAMFTLMNVSMFEGMDWYKAIETALASYGVVMRYVGNNIVKMSSLRSMPYQGEEFIEDIIHIEPTFVSGATRELIPAVKRIEERVEYDVTDSVTAPQLKSDDFTGESSSVVLSTSTGSQFILEGWSIKNTERGEGWMNNVGNPYFFPDAYDLSLLVDADSRDDEFMWFSFSQYATGDNRYAVYSRRMMPCAITMHLAFGSPYRLVNRVLTPVGNARADYAMIAIEVITDGVSYFLQKNGGWGNNLDLLIYNNEHVSNGELVIDIPTDGFNQSIILNVRIYEAGYDSWAQDTYIPLYSLDFSANNVVMEKNIVNTNYNAENNVILSRDPEIGPAYDKVAFPAFIKNGIFYRSGNAILPAKKWSWGSGSEQQMAVWNHLQLLSYYAKPNNLISGTIVNADITRAQAIYVWHGAEHMLVSGTYNFLNGHIESAILREFARYEDMWNEVAGAGLPDTEQDSRSNVEGGSASGGSSSTYSNTTTVNIGSGGGGGTGASNLNDLLDVDTTGVVAQSVLYYNGTSWVDMSLNTLLNPYLKADVAANTYALKSVYDAFVVSLGSLAYKNGLTASDIPDLSGIYLPKTGGTISGASGALTIARTDADQIGILFKGKSGDLGYLGFGSSGTPAYINISGTPYTLLHTGNYSSYVLPLSGGTISGTTNGPLVVNTTNATEVGIPLAINSSKKVWFGYSTAVGGAYMYNAVAKRYMGILDDGSAFLGGNTILHSGNYSEYALPKTGGTITFSGLYGLTLARTSNNSNFIHFTGGDKDFGYIGFAGVGNPIYADYNGVSYTLIHSGNIENQSVDKATRLRTLVGGDVPDIDTLSFADWSIRWYSNIPSSLPNLPTHNGYQNGLLVFPLHSAGTTAQMYMTSGNYLGFRGTTSGAWKTIAFTDSNVASATKLQDDTAFTAWGNTFFENGKPKNVTSPAIMRYLLFSDSDGGESGFIGRGGDDDTLFFRSYKNAPIYIGRNNYNDILIKDGNILIGTTTDNGAKLQVDGGISINSYNIDDASGIRHCDNGTGYFVGRRNSGLGVTNGGLLLYSYGATPMSFYTNSYERMHITASGNVGIGTTNPQTKLDVNGLGRFIGGLYVYGTELYVDTKAGFTSDVNINGAVAMASTLSVGGVVSFGNYMSLPNNTGIYFYDASGTIRSQFYVDPNNDTSIGYGAAVTGGNTRVYGKEVVIGTGTSRIDRLIVSDSGATIKGNLVVQGDISA